MRRLGAGAALATGFMAVGFAGASAAERVVKFYNWSDDVDPAVL